MGPRRRPCWGGRDGGADPTCKNATGLRSRVERPSFFWTATCQSGKSSEGSRISASSPACTSCGALDCDAELPGETRSRSSSSPRISQPSISPLRLAGSLSLLLSLHRPRALHRRLGRPRGASPGGPSRVGCLRHLGECPRWSGQASFSTAVGSARQGRSLGLSGGRSAFARGRRRGPDLTPGPSPGRARHGGQGRSEGAPVHVAEGVRRSLVPVLGGVGHNVGPSVSFPAPVHSSRCIRVVER